MDKAGEYEENGMFNFAEEEFVRECRLTLLPDSAPPLLRKNSYSNYTLERAATKVLNLIWRLNLIWASVSPKIFLHFILSTSDAALPPTFSVIKLNIPQQRPSSSPPQPFFFLLFNSDFSVLSAFTSKYTAKSFHYFFFTQLLSLFLTCSTRIAPLSYSISNNLIYFFHLKEQ